VASGSRQAVIGLQIAGLGADLARGIVLTAVGLVALAPLQQLTLQAWGSDAPLSRAVVAGAAGAVSLGAVWKLFHAVPGFLWQFAVGLAVGLIVVGVT
jgi:PTS system mannose-specific IIC component